LSNGHNFDTGKAAMTGRGEISPEAHGVGDNEFIEKAHLSHIAMLRAARVRHKAIARGLQVYFDSVAAEQIPDEFLDILNRSDR
jgi:hypothetical protein